MNEPYISVIITAYNRREFLDIAIKSVLNQSLDKRYYEIIVIKNFDENSDHSIENKDIKFILSEGIIGEYLYKGINEAKGDIISFLDDDDYFEKNKLETIMNIFLENPDIVYYHNNQIIVNEKGELIKRNEITRTGKIDSNELFENWLNVNNLLFNLSSISIRKKYYIKYLNILKELKTHPDDFMLFCAMNESMKIFIDINCLTYYLSHNSASFLRLELSNINDLSKFRFQAISLFSLYAEATDHMMKNFGNIILKDMLKFRLMQEEITINFYERTSFEKESIYRFIQFIINIIKHRKHTCKYLISCTRLIFKYFWFSLFHFSDKSTTMIKLERKIFG